MIYQLDISDRGGLCRHIIRQPSIERRNSQQELASEAQLARCYSTLASQGLGSQTLGGRAASHRLAGQVVKDWLGSQPDAGLGASYRLAGQLAKGWLGSQQETGWPAIWPAGWLAGRGWLADRSTELSNSRHQVVHQASPGTKVLNQARPGTKVMNQATPGTKYCTNPGAKTKRINITPRSLISKADATKLAPRFHVTEFDFSGLHKYYKKNTNYKIAKLQNYKITKLQNYKITKKLQKNYKITQ